MNHSRKVIGVDARLTGSANAGIGRYISKFLDTLLTDKLVKSVDWVIFFSDKKELNQFEHQLKGQALTNFKLVFAPIRHYTLSEQIFMCLIFYSKRLTMLFVPHFNLPLLYFKPSAVVIHDLLWHEQTGVNVTTLPKLLYHLKHFFYRLTVDRTVSKAQLIFCPSQTVRQTISRFFPQATHKIQVVYEGVDLPKKSKLETQKKSKLNQIVYVGSLYPHKNLMVVFRALKIDPSIKLKIFSSRSVFSRQTINSAKTLGVEKSVSINYSASDEEIHKEICRSQALIQPSISEGFGLTILESLACGTKVVCSNISVFRELYTDFVDFFDPTNPNSLLEALERSKQRHLDLSKLKLWLTKFSWSKMSQQITHQLINQTKQ